MVSKARNEVRDIHAEAAPATEQARETAHKVVDQAAGKAREVEEKVRSEAGRLKAAAEDQGEAARRRIDKGLQRADQFIKERPLAAAGIAFGAGALAALLLRRS